MAALNYSDVSKLLKADFETGKLFWLPRPVDMFPSTRDAHWWNGRYAEKEAFSTKDSYGYLKGKLAKKMYAAHRVIWLLHCGAWPDDQIDHINGIRDDNRIANLRSVSAAENNRNLGVSAKNKSGVVGVFWLARQSKWVATIKAENRTRWLGQYESIDDAISARKNAELVFGFHKNHGLRSPKTL